MLPAVKGAKAAVATAVKPHIPIDRTMILLAFVFAAAWTVTGAMAAHLPRILEAAGATTRASGVRRRADRPGAGGGAHLRGQLPQPLSSAGLDAARLHHPSDRRCDPWLAGGGAASVFAMFHGAGNGILTIARGTLPLAIFGPQNYGYRLGIIGAPARMAQAAAPLLFSLLIDIMGSRVLIVSSALSLSALLALFLLRGQPPRTERVVRNLSFPSRPVSRKNPTWTNQTGPAGLKGLLRWAITPPQSYAVYLIALFLIFGLSYYAAR